MLTRAAFENAIVSLAAIGGSTNAVGSCVHALNVTASCGVVPSDSCCVIPHVWGDYYGYAMHFFDVFTPIISRIFALDVLLSRRSYYRWCTCWHWRAASE